MSFKFQVVKTGDCRYELPKVGKDMKCPVRAFLSPDLFEGTDERLWQQAANAASYPSVKAVYLMPDTHVGYHVPVGAVIVTDGVVAQAGSGYDIGCGIMYLRTDLRADYIIDPKIRADWIKAVESRVATGLGSHQPPNMEKVSHKQVLECLRTGALGLAPSDACERHFIPVDEKYFDAHRIERAIKKAAPQMGSLGGGNHYIEMQVDPATSEVWIMIHTGSRGYGWQTAEHYFHEGARHRGLSSKRREESWLALDEDLGQEFWAHHNSAANYAIANRHFIAKAVTKATEQVLKSTCHLFYEISHNLTQEETLWLPDGTTTKGIVHRKGSTRAFPAKHPDLVGGAWYDTGHPVLIPGSMLHGAAIMRPQDTVREAGCSVNHGSGRLMGRGQAKRELRDLHDDIDQEMKDHLVVCDDATVVKGIMLNHDRTPLDECGHVYKPLDKVLAVLTSGGIANIERRLLPVANIKGLE